MSRKPSRKQDIALIVAVVAVVATFALMLYLFPITTVTRSEWMGTIPAGR